MRIQFLRPLYAPDAGGDPGGDVHPEKTKPSDVLAQYGQDAQAALRMAERVATLMNDNYDLRRKNGDYKTEIDGLNKRVAPEGAVVLSGDDAKRWEAYQTIGKPEDLTKALGDRDAAQQELATLRRDKNLSAAAEAHGYKAAALGKLPSLAGKEVETREIEVEGVKVKRAFVKDEGKETALPDYITAHDPEFMPALAADATSQQQATGTGMRYPAQQGNGGKPAATNQAKTYIKNTNYAVPKRET